MDTLKQNKKQLEEAVANKLKEAKSLEGSMRAVLFSR